ncbi:hypothetical protein Tco_1062777 [Tanacetum coccineum]
MFTYIGSASSKFKGVKVVSSEGTSLGDQEDASKQGRKINNIDADAEITLVDESQGRHDDDLMFDTCVLNDEEVFAGQDMAEKEVSTADPVTTASEVVTTANVEVSTVCSTAAIITTVELTLAQTLAELKSNLQISFDEQEAIRLQAEFDEEVRLAREKDEANVALIEEWNDIQAKIEADQLLAKRLQAGEQV